MAQQPDKRNEVEVLREELTREVNKDAEVIAGQIFHRPGPDLTRLTQAQVDAIYARAYREDDREFLTREAQRAPQQFLDSVKRIGVTLPTEEPAPRPSQQLPGTAEELMAQQATVPGTADELSQALPLAPQIPTPAPLPTQVPMAPPMMPPQPQVPGAIPPL